MKNNDIPKKQIDAWRRREAEETADDCMEVVQHHAPLRRRCPRTATTRAAQDRSGTGQGRADVDVWPLAQRWGPAAAER
jgi:hypothetical protein